MLARFATATLIALLAGPLLLSPQRVDAQSKAVLVNDEMAHPPAIVLRPDRMPRPGTDATPRAGSRPNVELGLTEQAQPPELRDGVCVTPAGACASVLAPGSPCQCWDADGNGYSGRVQ